MDSKLIIALNLPSLLSYVRRNFLFCGSWQTGCCTVLMALIAVGFEWSDGTTAPLAKVNTASSSGSRAFYNLSFFLVDRFSSLNALTRLGVFRWLGATVKRDERCCVVAWPTESSACRLNKSLSLAAVIFSWEHLACEAVIQWSHVSGSLIRGRCTY